MRKTTLRLPEETMRTLKIKAAEEMTTITEIVLRALAREFQEGGKSKN